MKQCDQAYCEAHKDEILTAIKSGKVFIYPTDTIYGLGTEAVHDMAVEKIRKLKHRPDKPLSIIAPHKEWIKAHCRIPDETALDLLPGPYTLIVELRDQDAVSRHINPSGNSLGVRIPDHWFSKIIEEADMPFVTTSVNISGDTHMEKIEDVPQSILDHVDYVIYEGPKKGTLSTKIVLTS